VAGAGAVVEPVGAEASVDALAEGSADDSAGCEDAGVVAACAGVGEVDAVLPGSACAYPPARTTAPAADATVIHPVAVRTLRSPRSRASVRSRVVSVVFGDKVGLLGMADLLACGLTPASPGAGSEHARPMFRSGKDRKLWRSCCRYGSADTWHGPRSCAF
jgi:hypothetical protein